MILISIHIYPQIRNKALQRPSCVYKHPLITELADELRLKHPLLPTTSPYPTMRFETILITEQSTS